MLAQPSWPSSSRSVGNAASRMEVAAGRMLATLVLWQERGRQRRALASLDDAGLRDIGRSRAEATRECAKPVWRA